MRGTIALRTCLHKVGGSQCDGSDIFGQTDERTDGRTHERESFSSHRRCRETKNEFSTIKSITMQFFAKSGKVENYPKINRQLTPKMGSQQLFRGQNFFAQKSNYMFTRF